MAEELGKKALNGVTWNIINKFGTQILGILPSMILARLLGPSEFGLIAAANIFSGIAYVISTGSFGSALIQKKNTDHLDYCSVYYFNITINFAVYFIFFLLAPLFAKFLHEPLVEPIMRTSLLSLPILAFGQVHSIILRKELNFKAPAIRNLTIQFISAIIAIAMAFLGYGVWSIVFQGILQTLGGCVLNWVLCKWRPTLNFSLNRLKSMFGFSFNIYFNNIMHYCFTRGYDTTIAKVYSAESLSYYNRSFSTINIFISTATGVINSTLFPIFSKMQDDLIRMKYNLRRFVWVESFIISFVMLLAYVLSEPIFRFLYSSKWDPVIPLFQILCIWGLFVPFKSLLENILMALGDSIIILKNAIINKILIILTIALGWRWGVTYIVAAQVFTIAVEVLIYSCHVNKKINYGILDIIKDIFPIYTQLAVVFVIISFSDQLNLKLISYFTFNEMLISFFRIMVGSFISIISIITINNFAKNNGYMELINLIFNNYPNNHKIRRLLIWKK